MAINTKTVGDRRKIRFETFDDAVRDAEVLADAERRGTLRSSGNWTLGQAIGHVAEWARYSLDGYPPMPRPPWFMRLIFPLIRGTMLNRGFPAGIRIRGVEEGTFAVEKLPTEHAIGSLRDVFARLQQQCPATASPVFGNLSHEDWKKLNLRHAELHFSFFYPE